MMKRAITMIGNYIKELRQKKSFSLTELAEKAGVSKSYLSTIERNLQQNPSIQFLDKISQVLDTSVESLIQQGSSKEQSDSDSAFLDKDWIALVKEAMTSNIDKEEFKAFLEFQKWKKDNN